MFDKYPYGKRGSYPHMAPNDVAIWERFIEKFPDAYDEVGYDVKVGTPPEFNTIVNPETQGDAVNLYLKKIDVVGFKGNDIDIVEVKPRAGSSALGQAHGYKLLYLRDWKPTGILHSKVVTDSTNPDVVHVAQDLEVEVIVV